MHTARSCFLLLVLLVMSGCYSTSRMDRYNAENVSTSAREENGISSETIADASASSTSSGNLPGDIVLKLDRRSVLAFATDYSRDLQTKRDDLYRKGLSLFGTRRNFGIQTTGTIEYLFAGDEAAEVEQQSRAIASIERILPMGGSITIAGSAETVEEDLSDSRDRTTADIRLDQPLLAGSGYTASHDALIQAERDYIYALRAFTLERQDFAINTLQAYYNLLRQRKGLENASTNYHQFVFLRERSEALFKVNRAPAIDVLRSQQEELSALNRMTTADELYKVQAGRFLVQLGLPSDGQIELADDIPEMREITLQEERAGELALTRRLDLNTTRDQLADAERKLNVAKNAYLPDVNIFGQSSWSDGDTFFTNAPAADQRWQAGVRAEIPLDRRSERDAIRLAEIARDAARRALDEKTETILLDVREAYSRIRSLRVSVDVEQKNIEIAERRATNALLEFRNGRLSNRDVVEAANDLLNARNAYISALADYEIQRLTLLRKVGLLDVGRDGEIIELQPDA